MSQQQAGLRFDIYERVYLPEEVSGIRELDEVELIPQIQVAVEGDQAVIKGNLVLAGTYTSEGETRSVESLRHTIPVEITLPMSRITSVDRISVDIDNFDVDLLSLRSLNVTGVLSLHGIGMDNTDPQDSWSEQEEVVFVHRVQQEKEPESAQAQTWPQPREREEIWGDISDRLNTSGTNDGEQAVALTPQESEFKQPPEDEEDKKEMRIAFGSKKSEESKSFDFKSYLHKSDAAYRNPESPAVDEKIEEVQNASQKRNGQEAESSADALEWKKLFISGSEEQKFKKVRLVIVQKEETLEDIAKRYERKPQEIRLFNRLTEPDVSEGQVIYIP